MREKVYAMGMVVAEFKSGRRVVSTITLDGSPDPVDTIRREHLRLECEGTTVTTLTIKQEEGSHNGNDT